MLIIQEGVCWKLSPRSGSVQQLYTLKTSTAVFQMTFIDYPNFLLRITLVGNPACF